MKQSVTKYGHLRYTVELADIVALGANLTGTITLDSLPAGAFILAYTLKASTAVAGLTTIVGRPKLNGTLLGSGTTNLANTTGALVFNTVNPASLSAANALAVDLTATVNNLNTATAGQFDLVITYGVLATP
jgi:hypothetical protein